MKLLQSFLVFLLLTIPSMGADFLIPDQKIVGAENSIPLGELVELSVSKVEVKPLHYLSSSYTWQVFEVEDSELKDKKVAVAEGKLFFGAGTKEKKIKVVCAVTHLYGVKEGDKLTEIGTRTVILMTDVIVGGLPKPPNPPNPPNPKPPTPVPPSNELVQKLKIVIEKDVNSGNATKQTISDLADVYGEASNSNFFERVGTWAELYSKTFTLSLNKQIPRRPYMVSIRDVIEEHIGKMDPNTVLTDSLKESIAKKFGEVSNSLKEANK